MMTGLRSFALFFLASVIPSPLGLAHTPVDFLEVLSVVPARPIEHSVELKSTFDESKVETMLVGPKMFARPVECMARSVKKPRAYLNWFKIVEPGSEPVREVEVLDMVRGSSNKLLKIQTAEYLLSPSQLITTGSPDSIPHGLDNYKAYRVVGASSLDRQINLTGSSGPEVRRLGKPLFVCLPTREWHHDDYSAASHPNDGFVVYELDAHRVTESVSTIDQFGLNELQATKTQWLCVRAALLRKTAE